MCIRKTGVLAMSVSKRCLLALGPLIALLFSGCILGIGEETKTEQVHVAFATLDRLSMDVNGQSLRLEGSGSNFGVRYDKLAVTFEISDDNFRCMILAESARQDGLPLEIRGFREA